MVCFSFLSNCCIKFQEPIIKCNIHNAHAQNHCIQNLSKYLNIGHWKSFISKSAIYSCQMATKLYFLSLPFSQHEFYVRIQENPHVVPELSYVEVGFSQR